MVHEALRDYDGELPAYGHLGDTLEMLDFAEPSADVELLREVASRRVQVQGQALHGDAHLSNCLPSRSGLLWHDFETACHGPPEYDLAALVMRDRVEERGEPAAREALAAYGPHDADLLNELLPIYAAWIYASFLLALPRRPERAAVLQEGLDWLRQTAHT
jgi:Ser/Thr protein kinase RdoA (MazF antagonist)